MHADALAALLGGANGNLPDMLNLSQENDDEAMVGLAIALSLQEQGESGAGGGGGAGGQGLSLQGLSLPASSHAESLEVAQLSDTTASAAGSDDDMGSTAATEGSTLRTSPAEHAGSAAGSESGGSNVDSVSGRKRQHVVDCVKVMQPKVRIAWPLSGSHTVKGPSCNSVVWQSHSQESVLHYRCVAVTQ